MVSRKNGQTRVKASSDIKEQVVTATATIAASSDIKEQVTTSTATNTTNTTKTTKQTIPVLSKFEKTALISQRAAQIVSGSPLTFKNDQKLTNPIEIAKEELRLKTIPLYVIRILPNGTEEKWHVREFKW